ncbi:MAG: type II toxin-antitoxin system prevent-host-death family antitoxin [Deltaproteobacteria bacterium]|nr:type II toxin-antitoxin system prevent-host-death family antitoxin [Deltaproteobacteria bacterium]
MRSFTTTEFKAKCLQLLNKLEDQGILITKYGKPIAKILPINSVNPFSFYGCMKGKIKIKGDTRSTQIKWNAESR